MVEFDMRRPKMWSLKTRARIKTQKWPLLIKMYGPLNKNMTFCAKIWAVFAKTWPKNACFWVIFDLWMQKRLPQMNIHGSKCKKVASKHIKMDLKLNFPGILGKNVIHKKTWNKNVLASKIENVYHNAMTNT